MIANKDYLLIKAIKKAKCCCNGKDEGDDQSQTTLKKFAELTIDDINYMMDYPEDLPVCDVMAVHNTKTDEFIIIDTVGNTKITKIGYWFSTQEKAQEAINYGSYGRGIQGVVIKGDSTWDIAQFETSDGRTIYEVGVLT